MREDALRSYLSAAECIDKEVWTTVCNPGSRAIEFVEPANCIRIRNRLKYPVMLVHDTDLYKTEWGTLVYGKVSAYNEIRPHVRKELCVLGVRVYTGYPAAFMRKIVHPNFIADYLNIGNFFGGLEWKP
jgi:hypothetical protein